MGTEGHFLFKYRRGVFPGNPGREKRGRKIGCATVWFGRVDLFWFVHAWSCHLDVTKLVI